MIKMRPYLPSDRIAIRADSIDEEVSDDIEDDVFIRDGKSTKMSEENGLKRPLIMAPRNRKTNGKLHTVVPIMKKNRRKCWKCCEPLIYGLAAVTILIALIFLAALILTLFPIPLQKLKIWLKKEPQLHYGVMDSLVSNPEFVPCTQITVQRIWTKIFPRINSESPVRKVDLNDDGIKDIIFGYGIDDSIQYEGIALPKCVSPRQDDDVPCEGGVIALNGKTGELIWQRWTAANIFSILCNFDIDQDNYMDCIAAGRGGIVVAINGRNGNLIWSLKELDAETNSPIIIDLYTINSVRDLDGDGCPEIFAVHLEERKSSQASHIKLISGRNGKVIRSIPTPFREEVFVPMQLITQPDGTELILILTGGQNSPGGIYTLRLHTLMEYRSEKEFNSIYRTNESGYMSPAVLVDITGDFIDDIIVTGFNKTVYAIDGKNYSIIWNYSFPASESVSAIVPGHFNHDNITDFMVKYNTGPGFPVYYYSQTTILNGIDGRPIMSSMMTDSGGPNGLLAGVSISQTFGGDFFLHWQVQCRDKYDAKTAYEFIPDSDVILQARADTCVLRYNTSTVLKLYAIARHVEPPGAVIFSSDDIGVHLNRTQPNQMKKQDSISPLKHPKMLKKLLANKELKIPVDEPILYNPSQQKQRKSKLIIEDEIPQRRIEYRKKPNIYQSLPNEDEERRIFEQQAPIKPYLYSAYNNIPEREFLQKEYENEAASQAQRNPDEYQDLIYTDEQQEALPPELNNRPIRIRTKYPSNRDVRSEMEFINQEENATNFDQDELLPTISTTSTYLTTKAAKEQLNLWDLELEKEVEESQKLESDYSARQRRDDDSIKDENDFFLASISSTGVLLDSLDKNETSSIDFVFIVNVRESETYPPLFLPQDLSCVEEKMSAYKTSSTDELITLQKQILNQCLKSRLDNIDSMVPPRFESQVVITRISISCNCRSLQNGEICSKLEKVDRQKWTEFMGNTQNGIYKN